MNPRDVVMGWLESGLAAVQPDRLTRLALKDHEGPGRVIAIGKAAAGMCAGAEDALGAVTGLCVTNHVADVPNGVELLIGEHPVPGQGSLLAGRRALALAPHATMALISGGGSAICELPKEGLTIETLASVGDRLLASGASIQETNLVRRHLSKVKSGGLGPIPTFILSDVPGSDPGVVSSGPTIPCPHDPEAAIEILEQHGIQLSPAIETAIRTPPVNRGEPEVTVVGDGRTAANAVAAAVGEVAPAQVLDRWLTGPFETALEEFVGRSPSGVTVLAGEPSVTAHGGGRGGRSTHSALSAARLIAGTDMVFAALATDGEDGNSGSAGAIVDGQTTTNGGDPETALRASDSATYLKAVNALIEIGPTGTNVADIWLIWKP